MDRHPTGDRPAFPPRPLPPSFRARTVALPRDCALPVDEVAWRDALVIVERGEIDVECERGATGRFVAGDVIWLCGLDVHTLRNRGADVAVLTAISRRAPGAGDG